MCREFAMAGQEGNELTGNADWADAGSATAVRDAECFVEVEVANIGTDETGAGESDLGIHVGAVHVDLAAVLVDELADVADA
jgi:hypothetical protein